MRIIKCPGHEFKATSAMDGDVVLTVWQCILCKLIVRSKESMQYLTGKKS